MHHNHPYKKMHHQQQSHYADHDLPVEEPEDQPLTPELQNLEEPAITGPEQLTDQEARTQFAGQDAVNDAQAKLEEERMRMAADMENFKKRLTREHQEQMRYASEKVLSDLLPALDNLDLAIQYGNKHEACSDMMQGIEMTRRQLLDAVAKSGLTLVGKRGEQFDPALHEAIGMEQDPELEKGAVTRVLQSGYKLQDRLLRPAKVMVNN